MCPATIVLTDACALRTANRGGQHHTAHRGAADGRGGRQPARQPQAPHLELAAAFQDQAPQEGPLGCDFFPLHRFYFLDLYALQQHHSSIELQEPSFLGIARSDSGPAPVEAACAILCSLRHLEHVPQNSQACRSLFVLLQGSTRWRWWRRSGSCAKSSSSSRCPPVHCINIHTANNTYCPPPATCQAF